MTEKWALKVRRWDGSTSVLALYRDKAIADEMASAQNKDTQSHQFYVEHWNPEEALD